MLLKLQIRSEIDIGCGARQTLRANATRKQTALRIPCNRSTPPQHSTSKLGKVHRELNR